MPSPIRTPRSDGVATRKAILEAAGHLISEAGLAQATSKQIAARASVDIASINHHFGNRSGLYQAVLAEAHRRLLDAKHLERLAATIEPAEQKLKALIRLLVQGGAMAPNWPLIVLMREVMAPSAHLMALQQEEVLPKLQRVLPILSELTALSPDDPRLWRCLPSIAAPCALFALAGKLDSPLTNRFSGVPAEVVVEQLFAFTMGGLAAISRGLETGPKASPASGRVS